MKMAVLVYEWLVILIRDKQQIWKQQTQFSHLGVSSHGITTNMITWVVSNFQPSRNHHSWVTSISLWILFDKEDFFHKMILCLYSYSNVCYGYPFKDCIIKFNILGHFDVFQLRWMLVSPFKASISLTKFGFCFQ